MRAQALTAAGLLAAMAGGAAAACDPGAGSAMRGPAESPFSVALNLSHAPIVVSAPFRAAVTVCSAAAGAPDRITIDATMPAHQHGMNYNPVLNPLGDGRYEVEGLFFHMPGLWRFEVVAYSGGTPHRFLYDVDVE